MVRWKAALWADEREWTKAAGLVVWKVEKWVDSLGLGRVAALAGMMVVSLVELKAEMTADVKVAGLE